MNSDTAPPPFPSDGHGVQVGLIHILFMLHVCKTLFLHLVLGVPPVILGTGIVHIDRETEAREGCPSG